MKRRGWPQGYKPPADAIPDLGHPSLDGIIGWWMPLEVTNDATVRDLSGYGRDGSVVNGIDISIHQAGPMWDFDGTSDRYIKIPGLLGKPQQLSMMCWVNINDVTPVTMQAMSLGNYVNIAAHLLFGFDVWTANYHPTASVAGSQSVIGAGWHHLAYVCDVPGAKQTLYLDGNVDATSTFSTALTYTGQGADLVMGVHGNNLTGNNMDGLLDDCRVYGRLLTQEQVRFIKENPYAAFRVKRRAVWILEPHAVDFSEDVVPLGLVEHARVVAIRTPHFHVPRPLLSWTGKLISHPRARDLLGWWIAQPTLAGMVLDASGNAADLTVSGVTLAKDGTWSFGGDGDHLSLSGLFGEPQGALTFSAVVNYVGSGAGEVLTLGDYICLRVDDTVRGTGGFYHHSAGSNFLVSNVNITGTGWHTITAVYDLENDKQIMYLDGVVIASHAYTQSTIDYDGLRGPDTLIGKHGDGSSSFHFDGEIADVRLWNRALQPAEVQSLIYEPYLEWAWPARESYTSFLRPFPLGAEAISIGILESARFPVSEFPIGTDTASVGVIEVATVRKYVTDVIIAGGGGDYTTIQGWADNYASTTLTTEVIGEIRDNSTYDEHVTFTAITTTSEFFMRLSVAPANRANGVAGGGCKLHPTTAGHAINSTNCNYFVVEHLEIHPGTGASNECFRVGLEGTMQFCLCIGRGYNTAPDQQDAMFQDNTDGGVLNCFNCMIQDFSRSGVGHYIGVGRTDTVTLNVRNCTIINCGTEDSGMLQRNGGIHRYAVRSGSTANANVDNCICLNNASNNFGETEFPGDYSQSGSAASGSWTGSGNIASDGTATARLGASDNLNDAIATTNTAPGAGVYVVLTNITSGSEDLHLKHSIENEAENVHSSIDFIDTTAYFIEDIDGDTRTAAFMDGGADQISSSIIPAVSESLSIGMIDKSFDPNLTFHEATPDTAAVGLTESTTVYVIVRPVTAITVESATSSGANIGTSSASISSLAPGGGYQRKLFVAFSGENSTDTSATINWGGGPTLTFITGSYVQESSTQIKLYFLDEADFPAAAADLVSTLSNSMDHHITAVIISKAVQGQPDVVAIGSDTNAIELTVNYTPTVAPGVAMMCAESGENDWDPELQILDYEDHEAGGSGWAHQVQHEFYTNTSSNSMKTEVMGTTPRLGIAIAAIAESSEIGEVFGVGLTETATVLKMPVASDTFSIGLLEVATVEAIGGGIIVSSEVIPLGLIEVSSFGLIETPVAETVGVGLLEPSTILVLVAGDESATVGLVETATVVVTLSNAEALPLAALETSAITVSTFPVDAVGLGLLEQTALISSLTPSETDAVGLLESSSILASVAVSESATVGLGENVDLVATLTVLEALPLGVVETATVLVLTSFEETVTVQAIESSAIVVSAAVDDVNGVGLSDATELLVSLSLSEATTVGLSETVTLAVTLPSSGGAVVQLVEQMTIVVSTVVSEANSLGLIESPSFNNSTFMSEANALGLGEAPALDVTQATTLTDLLPIGLIEVGTKSVLADNPVAGSEILPVGLLEATDLEITDVVIVKAASESFTIGWTEAVADVQVNLSPSDLVPIGLGEISGTIESTINTGESATLGLGERTANKLSVQVSEIIGLGVIEIGQVSFDIISIVSADLLAVGFVENFSVDSVTITSLDAAALGVSETVDAFITLQPIGDTPALGLSDALTLYALSRSQTETIRVEVSEAGTIDAVELPAVFDVGAFGSGSDWDGSLRVATFAEELTVDEKLFSRKI